jgi:hypothetical protein
MSKEMHHQADRRVLLSVNHVMVVDSGALARRLNAGSA